MIVPCTACPHKQRDTRPAGTLAHVPVESGQNSRQHIEEITRYGVGNPMMDKVYPDLTLRPSIGALVLREDGWAALKPEYERGDVYTTQFVFEGDGLRINARCDYGFVRVEALDSKMEPYPGFSAEECVPVHGPADRIWHDVRWTSCNSLRGLWNKPIRLRFHLLEAALYGFQFHYSE